MSLLNTRLCGRGFSTITQPLTLVCRSLSCRPKKAADSLWTDDKVLQRRVQSWALLSCCDSRCLVVCPPFPVASSPRSDPAQQPLAPDLKAEHGLKLLAQVG